MVDVTFGFGIKTKKLRDAIFVGNE